TPMFHDREDAGRQVAEALKGRRLYDPVVLGIPRGGVVIGAVLAEELGAELDVVLSRKLRAPDQPEFALGAVSEDGRVFLNPSVPDAIDLSGQWFQEERLFQMDEIARRRKLFRSVRPPVR